MPPPESRVLRFVRALLKGSTAIATGENHFVTADAAALRLEHHAVRSLIASGVLVGTDRTCRAAPCARQWLRRQMLDADAFAAQHRVESRRPDGTVLNLAESPLARLAQARPGQCPFLGSHHLEAGERVRRLVERAQLQPRLTTSYSAAHIAGAAKRGKADVTDAAADARRRLNDLIRSLPPDCAGVVVDVCGMLKGLQEVELERGWPRRSAKLVLRIGLEQVAVYFRLTPVAVGKASRQRTWHEAGAYPTQIG